VTAQLTQVPPMALVSRETRSSVCVPAVAPDEFPDGLMASVIVDNAA